MFKVIRSWLDHFFADEQALLLVVLLAVGLASILLFGSTLAPVFASMILAYLTLGLVQWLERFGVNHLPAVWGIYSLFVALLLTFVFIVLPLLWHQATDLLSNLPLMLETLMGLFLLLPEQYPELVSASQIEYLVDAAMAELAADCLAPTPCSQVERLAQSRAHRSPTTLPSNILREKFSRTQRQPLPFRPSCE